MDDQVERMIEGRDGRHDPDRLLDGEGPADRCSPASAPSGSRGRRSCAARRPRCARHRWRGRSRPSRRVSGLPPSRAICRPKWSRVLSMSAREPPQDRRYAACGWQPAVPIAEGLRGGLELALERGRIVGRRSRRSAPGRTPGRPAASLTPAPPARARRAALQLLDQHARVLRVVDRHVDQMHAAAAKGGFERRHQVRRRSSPG